MDSRGFDVVVVGAGISGLTAACAAARQKQKVALVATGPGSFVLGSGCLMAQEFIRPGAAQEIAEAIALFCEMAQDAGCPFGADIPDGRSLPDILGEFQSVALAPRFLWNAEPRNGGSTAIIGIRELSCFDENFMTERLNEQAHSLGFVGTYAARQISLARFFKGPVTTVRIAARFDSDPGFRAELVSALRIAAPGFERILVPSVLGLNSSAEQLSQFESELGCSLSELPTLPPSISGLRLFHRIWNHLHNIGVELFQGFPVEKLAIHDDLCTELQIASPGHPMILRTECIVLAAGQHSCELLGNTRAGQDKQMRPITSSGSVMAWNLLVTETCSHDGVAMEIYAGYRAGNLAAATRGQYAAG